MVLCNYFINGSCRFGSKCVNDHIDLKTLLKSEVESAINGKQWLLSCFGPFKESAVIPNLLDRSFEEVRFDFLEASKSGTTQQHVSELISQYNDSMAKLNHLKMGTPDTIQLVANIYNQSTQEQKKPAAPVASNVFSLSNVAASSTQPQQQNPFQMGSVFGGTQVNQPPAMDAGNIFGAAPTASNPFQTSTQSSIFGGSKEQQQPSAASNFSFALGQQSQQPQQSIFGTSTSFGAPQPAQQQQSTGSIFGGQTNSFGGNSVFGSAPQQQPQQQVASSMFGGGAVFGQTQQAPVANVFASVQQQAPGANIFGVAQQPSPSSNVFGSIQQSSSSANVFGSSQQQVPGANVFGSTQQQAPGSSVFAVVQQQGQNQNQFAAQPSGNIFSSFQTQQDPNAQQPLYPQQAAAAPTQNLFGIQQIMTQPPQTQTGSIFQIQQTNQNPQQQGFGGNPFGTQAQQAQFDDSIYSKPEDLTPEELAAFQADSFEIGKIPLKPPPKHLCF